MAKAHVYLAPGANVETTDTFASWIDTTNQLVYDMGTVVLTSVTAAQPNTTIGGYTAGNSHLQGILSANTLVATQSLRGGTVSTPANLTVSSNVIFNTSELIRVDANTNNFTINANNMNITSNVSINEATKTVTITAANTTINAGVFYVRSNTELTGTRVDITSNTIFTSSRLNANVDVITLGFNGSDTLSVNSISDFNANVNIDGVFTVTANAVFTGANTTVAVLEATDEIRLKGAAKTLKVQGTTTAQPLLNISLANTSVTVTPMVVNSTSVLPGANNTYALGANLMRWDKTWTKDLDVSNTLTVQVDADVSRDMIVRRDLYVYGNTSFASGVSLAIDASDIQDLNVLGTLSMVSGARVDTNFIPANNAVINLGSTTSGWNALYANTIVTNTIVANTITSALTGNATTATTLQTARTINGISFNGSNNITIPAVTDNTLIRGTYLTGNNFNGSANTTWAVDATNLATASKIVARDAAGNFVANTITATLSGNATTATALQTTRTINGIPFNGSNNIIIPAVTDSYLINGTYLTGDAFNGGANTTWSVDATNLATASKIVARDAAGSFAANTITANTITATTVTGNGSGLTSLNGTNITTGTIDDARIATTLVRTSRTVSPGDGLSGGGDLSANRSLAVDSTVVRTTGAQTLGGVKTFTNGMIGNVTGSITGNAATATTFTSDRTNYITATNTAVAGELMWKNFGNGHTVFDASNSTSPGGQVVSNITAATAWIPTYPTLMGWNGTTTYGVRVDSARVANTVTNGVYTTGDQTIAGTKTFSSTISGSINGNAATVTNGVYTTGDQTIAGTKTFSSQISGSISGNAGGNAATVTNGVYTTGNQTIAGIKTFSENMVIRNTSPTIHLRDTDGSNAFLHCNSNLLYVLRGGADATTWAIVPGLNWPMTLNLDTGDVTFGGNVSAYSDERLKTNIRTIDSALDKVSNMRGVYFDYNGRASVGVIAQEVLKVLPEVVSQVREDDDHLAVAYGNIVGILIEAIKELKTEIEELKKGR